jgi:hypothetical protein
MKNYIKTTIIMLLLNSASGASVADPVADYRNLYGVNNKEALCKVVFDWNADGKNDICICNKKQYDGDIENDTKIFWTIYVANANDNLYTKVGEQEEIIDGETVLSGDSIWFDPDHIFIGSITEINKHGLLSFHIDNPRDGEPVAYIYALVYKDGVFTEHELAKYNAKEENALFEKYLKDDKRTQLTVEQIPAVEDE